MRITISGINGNYVDRAVNYIREGYGHPNQIWIWNSGANEGEVWTDIRIGIWPNHELLKQLYDLGRISHEDYLKYEPVIDQWGHASFQSLIAESFEGA
jgi:hypothetical protein